MKTKIIIGLLLAGTISAQAGVVNWVALGLRDPGNTTTAITSTDKMYVELYYTIAAGGTTEGWEGTFGSGGSLITGSQLDLATGTGKIDGALPTSVGNSFWSQAQAVANRDPGDGFASFYMKIYYNAAGSAGNTDGSYTYLGTTHLYALDLNNITSGDATISMSGTSSGGHVSWVPAAVPEPASMALFGLGGIALLIRRKMRKEA